MGRSRVSVTSSAVVSSKVPSSPDRKSSSCPPTLPPTLVPERCSPSKCTTRTCLKPFLPSASTPWSKPWFFLVPSVSDTLPLATSALLTLLCALLRSSRSAPRRLATNGLPRSSSSPPTAPLRSCWFLNNPSLATPSTTAPTLPVSPCWKVSTAAPSERSPRSNKYSALLR